jgi:hypothetical protein
LHGEYACSTDRTCKAGGCVCNFFGCNCEGCNCPVRRELQSIGSNATNATAGTTNVTANNCTDYYYYMNLTLAEKVAHFEETNCVGDGLFASAAMVRKLEGLADANGNGVLSCEEFNGAYFKNNSTTVESFCTVNTNFTFTTAPASAPVGPTSKTSSVMRVQTFLATVLATVACLLIF